MTERLPELHDRLQNPAALLSRSDLAELGHPRRSVDATFLALPTIHIPGYSRPFITVADYTAFIKKHTYKGDRVRAA